MLHIVRICAEADAG